MKQILFNTEMVKAILENRKTQTRRPLKRQPPNSYHYIGVNTLTNKICFEEEKDSHKIDYVSDKLNVSIDDILYVRETFSKVGNNYFYKADAHKRRLEELKWKPAMHMPKEASRLFLKIKDIRLQKIQDMTEEEAKAEGIRGYWQEPHNNICFIGHNDICDTAVKAFNQVWDSIYSKTYPVKTNPYVLVYEFERCEKP